MPPVKITDDEAFVLYLLNLSGYGWSDNSINTVEPGRLGDNYTRLQLAEIKRLLPSLARKGLAATPEGYAPGEAFQLLPALEDAWRHWYEHDEGFNKIENFKSE